MPVLVLFGDSICRGYGASPGEAWANQLAKKFNALSDPVRVVNAGVCGDTSGDGLRRMAHDVEAVRPDSLYVQFGLNDACWHGSVPVEMYIANMREISCRAFQHGCSTVFIATNHPVRRDAWGVPAYQRTVAQYNAALRKAFAMPCGGKHCLLIDLEQKILRDARVNPTNLVAADGVHLSPEGNRYYAAALGEMLPAALGLGAGKGGGR